MGSALLYYQPTKWVGKKRHGGIAMNLYFEELVRANFRFGRMCCCMNCENCKNSQNC